jgi:CRISPR-associated protein Cas6
MVIELVFPVMGESVPIDHHYPLYAALSHIVPEFHAEDSVWRFGPILGVAVSPGKLQLPEHARLCLRLPDDAIRHALPLAGKRLDIAGHHIRLGVPTVRTLWTSPQLSSRIVTFKNAETPEQFLKTAREKLSELEVSGEPSLPLHLQGERAGEVKRRIVRIRGVSIIGYSLLVSELSAEDSLRLQEHGLGGRTHIGCGFFMPVKEG